VVAGALMLTTDPLLLEMFRYSNTVVAKLDLYDGTELVQRDVKITTGGVTSNWKANNRRNFTATVALNSWEDLPINVFSSRVKVYVGVETLPGIPRFLPQGSYRVDQVARQKAGALDITGTSYEVYVIQDRFWTPRTPSGGVSTINSIKTLVSESFPSAEFVVTATKDKVVEMTAPWERERWDAVTALAESINAEVYCDAEGKFVIADKVDFVKGSDPVWKVNVGPDGVLVTETIANTRDKVYNAVVAYGSTSEQDKAPVTGVVWDSDPTSKTWYDGPFGRVSRFYSNPGFTTVQQCEDAARNMLAESIAENREVNFTTVPNPALEVCDVIQLSMLDGTIENHMITELNIPLGLGAYTASTLASKATSVDGG
jgi:hypothetical protein